MPKFYSWRKVAKALNTLGFSAVRQRGSHIVFKGTGRRSLFLMMSRQVPGLIGAIAAEIGKTREEFERLMDQVTPRVQTTPSELIDKEQA